MQESNTRDEVDPADVPYDTYNLGECLKVGWSCCIVVISLILTTISLNAGLSVIRYHPLILFCVLISAVWLLAYLEGLHYAVVSVERSDIARYRTEFPRGYATHDLVRTSIQKRKFLAGRQFLVIVCVFCTAQITCFPECPNDFLGLPEYVITLLLRTGLAGVMLVLTFGQLLPELICEEFTMSFLNMTGSNFVVRLALLAEWAGVCHFSWLLYEALIATNCRTHSSHHHPPFREGDGFGGMCVECCVQRDQYLRHRHNSNNNVNPTTHNINHLANTHQNHIHNHDHDTGLVGTHGGLSDHHTGDLNSLQQRQHHPGSGGASSSSSSGSSGSGGGGARGGSGVGSEGLRERVVHDSGSSNGGMEAEGVEEGREGDSEGEGEGGARDLFLSTSIHAVLFRGQNCWECMKYLWSTLITLCCIGIMTTGILNGYSLLQFSGSSSLIILLALLLCLVALFYLEGLLVAIAGTQYWDRLGMREHYPRAYLLHQFVSSNYRVKRFMIGRQFLTVLMCFLMAGLTTFPHWPEPAYITNRKGDGYGTWLHFLFFRSGLCGVLTVLAFGQLVPELLAAEYPLRFLNFYGSYSVVWACLLCESLGVGQCAWVAFYMIRPFLWQL